MNFVKKKRYDFGKKTQKKNEFCQRIAKKMQIWTKNVENKHEFLQKFRK